MMNMNSIIKKINTDNINLWKNSSSFLGRITKYYPLLYPEFKRKNEKLSIFIGLNPSFSERSVQKYVQRIKGCDNYSKKKSLAIFTWPEYYNELRENRKINKMIEIERIAQKEYKYFNLINKWSDFYKIDMFHLDLFSIREKNQKALKSKLSNENLNHETENFFNKQRDFSLQMIKNLNPDVIVVINAFASQLIFNEWEIQSDQIFSEKGYHLLTTGKMKIPIFFSSMISGQRALDVFSRDRLFWNIHKVLDIKWQGLIGKKEQ